jgi:dienelactone hydrolase
MKRRKFFGLVAGAAIVAAGTGRPAVAEVQMVPATVYFPSADGRTELVGYLFAPQTQGPHPAVVMLHGRAGPYSSNISEQCTLVAKEVSSPCNAASLSKRHMAWGEYWAERGYLALLPTVLDPATRLTASKGSATMTRTAMTSTSAASVRSMRRAR